MLCGLGTYLGTVGLNAVGVHGSGIGIAMDWHWHWH